MKKFGKFLTAALALAAAAGGVYYFMKNVSNKEQKEDLDDFEEDFDDFDLDDEEEEKASGTEDSSSREYVTINPDASKDTEEGTPGKAPEAAPSEN